MNFDSDSVVDQELVKTPSPSPKLWYEHLDKVDILASMKKFDQVGRITFNVKTGYPTKSYFIQYQGSLYDCMSVFVNAYLCKYSKETNAFKTTKIEGLPRPYAEKLGFAVVISHI